MPLVRRTRATLRSAEFGFFGVVVYTRVQTPRRWGEPFNAGVLVFSTLSSRPLRTSWLIVGMGGLDLLPALGWCSVCLSVVPGAGPAGGLPAPGHPSSSGPRGRACRPARDRPMTDRTWFAPRDSAPPPSGFCQWADPDDQCWSSRRTANGSRPRAPWAQQPTVPAPWKPVKTGSHVLGHTVAAGHRRRSTPSPTREQAVLFQPREVADATGNQGPAGDVPRRGEERSSPAR